MSITPWPAEETRIVARGELNDCLQRLLADARVGSRVMRGHDLEAEEALELRGRVWAPMPDFEENDGLHAGQGYVLKALMQEPLVMRTATGRETQPGDLSLRVPSPRSKSHNGEASNTHLNLGHTLAWITLSDKGAAGQRMDLSGPDLESAAREGLDICLAQGFILPDDGHQLKALLTDLALVQGYDLICTTGGTGLAPRDITPDITASVIEKRLPGFEQAMMQASLAKTPHAVISRAVVGTLGRSIIVNLPGSRKAVRENLEAILPALGHALAKLQGDPADCGG